MRYRKKPVVIEAIQFTDSASARRIVAWADGKVTTHFNRHGDMEWLYVETLEGDIIARPGWWIIRGIVGEFYPCDPEVFAGSYEKEPDQ